MQKSLNVGLIFFILISLVCCLPLITLLTADINLYTYDYRNYATDESVVNSIAASGYPLSIPHIGDCNSAYLLSDTNRCIRSKEGVYWNRGVSSPQFAVCYGSIIDSNLGDHETNTISARIFVNPSIILGTLIEERFIDIHFGQDLSFSLGVKYVPGTSPTKGIYFEIMIASSESTANYFGSTDPMIPAPSWVDVSAVFRFVQGSVDM